RVTLEQMEMGYFEPVARRYNVRLTGGTLGLAGQFEFAPSYQAAVFDNVTVRGAHVEYIHTPQTAREESQTASTAAQTGKEVTNRQDIDLAIKQLDIVGATIGYVNQAAATPYRAFFTDTELHLTNLTNKSDAPEARAEMRGRFMGSGPTRMSMAFRPHQKGGS